MKCSYCGTETAGWQLFCPCCGTRQAKPEEVAYRSAPVQPVISEETQVLSFPEPDFMVPEISEEEAAAEFPDIPAFSDPSPALLLPVKRGLAKMFFLGILTLGIYPTVIWGRLVQEVNIVCSRYDGERTMSYFGMLMVAPITLMVYPLVWMHALCRRIGDELQRRSLGYTFGPKAFWLWGVLGCLILVGPFVFIHKLMKAMNYMKEDYNKVG